MTNTGVCRGLAHRINPSRALADLRDTAGGRFEFLDERCLDRIDNQQPGIHLLSRCQDSFDTRFSQNLDRAIEHIESICPQLDLFFRLLAGHIQGGCFGSRGIRGCLQNQRRLADSRVPTNQRERSRHDPAAKHPINLADPSRLPGGKIRDDLGE